MSRLALTPVFFLIIFSGCRTYGGYDSKELNLQTLDQLEEKAANMMGVAERELQILEGAASQGPELAIKAFEFGHLLERNRQLVAELGKREQPDTYRSASRAAGALISEINVLATGYHDVKMDIAMLRGVPVVTANTREDLSYGVVPPYYRQIKLYPQLSMRDALGLN